MGQIPVNTWSATTFTAVVSPSQQWMYGTDPSTFPMHYTFNTPVGAAPASQCGRVMYSDFHVSTGATGTGSFPGECSLGTGVKLTPQEKVLEYMLFDLTSCVRPDVPMCASKSVRRPGLHLRDAGRRLRQRHQLRRLYGPADLWRRRLARNLRRADLHAAHLRQARLQVRRGR